MCFICVHTWFSAAAVCVVCVSVNVSCVDVYVCVCEAVNECGA